MAASMSTSNKITSYFFIFDFYHMKGASDDVDLLPECILYFYPENDNLKEQKLLDMGEMIGLMQCFKYDLFSCIPQEFHYKKSLVITEHYERLCAFLVLSGNRFTTDESRVHLTHILNLFHMVYGTWNHIQSIYTEVNKIQTFLKQTLTPIIEYVFNENRSVQNLFSAIDYVRLKKNNHRSLLHCKHLLSHLESTHKIKAGMMAYEKRILYSTLDTDTMYYIQVLLGLQKKLPANEIYFPWKSEMQLKNGVSLLRIYIRRPLSLEPMLQAINLNTTPIIDPQTPSQPIDILNPLLLASNETPSLHYYSNNIDELLSTSDNRNYNSMIKENPAGSSEETGFDTDRAEDMPSPNKTETSSAASSVSGDRNLPFEKFRENDFSPPLSSNSHHGSLTDEQKRKLQSERSRSPSTDSERERSQKTHQQSCLNDDSAQLIFEIIQSDGCESGYDEKDAISLPPMPFNSNSHRSRTRTVTNGSDMNYGERNGSEGHARWGDTPVKNDENERDEYVLYVQRNSRMMFSGIVEKNMLSDEYLQKLWYLMVSEMAQMDTEIQVIPTPEELIKGNTDVKFQFNEDTGLAQFELLSDANHYYRKIPSADSVCMAVNARSKLNQNPDRKMIGLSRGNNLISVNRYLPDRLTYSCRRVQELQ